MENLESETFDYSGYQVVRGEFFAHIKEPSITFNNCQIYVNMSCLNKLPQTQYIHILVNSTEKKIVLQPCPEEEKDSFAWCSDGNRRRPKHITCRIFFAKIMQLMDWNPEYRYKMIGKLVKSNEDLLFVFDLKTAETYVRATPNNKKTTFRTPLFPANWKEQFGLPVEEHRKSLQINIYNGYAVFGLKDTNIN